MDEKQISTNKGDFEKFSNKDSNLPLIVYWLTFVLSLIFIGVFWFLSFNLSNALEEKRQEKNQVLALLSSPDIVEVEEEAQKFYSVVNRLSEVSGLRVKKTKLLEDLFKNFTKDIRINTISISSSGGLSMGGVAPSYKSVGELILALKENERISNVRLGGVSMQASESIESNENVVFSVSSSIDMTKESGEVGDEQE